MSFKHVKFFSRFVGVLLLLTLSGSYLMPSLAPVPAAVQDVQVLYQEDAARLTSEQAVAVALNDLEATADGYRLSHPQHTASFTAQGVTFTPKRGGPAWSWQLTAVGAGDRPLAGARLGAVAPLSTGASVVAYERGVLLEQYLARGSSVEQQFVIPRSLRLGGADLVIEGAVQSTGQFEEAEDGWSWRAGTGAVHLGDARVFDAAGEDLPATMQVTVSATRIVVDGPALAKAAYPVTIDPVIGTNYFRLSDMGHEDPLYNAWDAAVAYNSTDNEYLVIWRGDDNTGALVRTEYEIYGQRVDAATGAEIGMDMRLSDMGSDGDTDYNAYISAVAYNSTNNEYLVVWSGDDDTAPLIDSEYEIFGQRVNAATGEEVGVNDFRISNMGPDGDYSYYAGNPDVTYNSTANEYLVVWSGVEVAQGALEVYGQRVDAVTGNEIGTDMRLSDMGPDGSELFAAEDPAVAYNSTNNEYLVVWSGADDIAPLVADEDEVFGQRVDANGAEIGINDFRISDMGPDGDPDYDAYDPDVAYNSTGNEYLVVWDGDDNTGDLVDEEFEIFGQRLDAASGTEVGDNDVRLSDMGPDGDTNYDTARPAVAYNSAANEYLVVWQGKDDIALSMDDEEIFGQRLNGVDGSEVGTNDFRLSDMGPDGDSLYLPACSAVAYGSTAGEYLVVWHGDDDTAPLVDNEHEIFGQRVAAATGAEVGENDLRLSNMGRDRYYDAETPAVAYNDNEGEYLVVWAGDDNTGDLVDEEFEIYGQRVDAVTGEELGEDIRLSDMGPDGDTDYDAAHPDVAYNGTDNEYLVVWEGDDNTGDLVDDEYEIYGQRVDGEDGSEVGDDVRLSDMGVDGLLDYGAHTPAVAYNSTNNEYLVVWSGDNYGLSNDDFDIYGQRVNGASGAEVGDDLQLSDMGPDLDAAYGGFDPDVAYNSTDNEYLVVWWGDDNSGGLVDDEFEIFGQRLNGVDGSEVGTNDVRLSDMGPDGDTNYKAEVPAVAYNSVDNEYLVVWQGDDNSEGLVDDECEIFGQRVDGEDGSEVGPNDVRLSDMGPNLNASFDARAPDVAYNSGAGEYLVVWRGDDNSGSLVDSEDEIYGQRVDAASGAEIGEDLRLSDMGPDGDKYYGADYPAAAGVSSTNEYLVVWEGTDNTSGLTDNEYEIFGQRFAAPPVYLVYLPLIVK